MATLLLTSIWHPIVHLRYRTKQNPLHIIIGHWRTKIQHDSHVVRGEKAICAEFPGKVKYRMAMQVGTEAFQVCQDPPENMPVNGALAKPGGPINCMDQHANNSGHVVTPHCKDDGEARCRTR